jgi:hypothetical protein
MEDCEYNVEYNIKGLKLVQTCSACPEQYDVFDETGEKVAYLRLRWGYFSARVPNSVGQEVYDANIGDGMTGCFTGEAEREKHLTKAVKAIKKELKKKE